VALAGSVEDRPTLGGILGRCCAVRTACRICCGLFTGPFGTLDVAFNNTFIVMFIILKTPFLFNISFNELAFTNVFDLTKLITSILSDDKVGMILATNPHILAINQI
jgi:hypothetical protein